MAGCGRILERAATIGAGMARAVAYVPRDPEAALYGSWRNAFVGGSHEFLRGGARLLDARTQFHYLATVITPAMAHAQVGAGSATGTRCTTPTAICSTAPRPTGCTSTRTRRRRTSGRSTYTTPRPARCFRSHRRAYPALASNSGTLQANEDGSYDLYFGPQAPSGAESNWVETIPGKSWFQLFRLDGPLQPWFDQTWRLNEFEPIA